MDSELFQYRGNQDVIDTYEHNTDWNEATRLQIRARIMEAVTRHHDETWQMAHRRREEILKGRYDY